ncbi:hypothetical protein AX16_001750 [Volvariella volvacea WC 439]|nr:hypothetical protein AX16_001750 [Volvariella volvacea WC 439]
MSRPIPTLSRLSCPAWQSRTVGYGLRYGQTCNFLGDGQQLKLTRLLQSAAGNDTYRPNLTRELQAGPHRLPISGDQYNTITFYDIPSSHPIIAWSPNAWKIRYALNYKGLPYKTEWVEYPNIAAICKRIGAAPTAANRLGQSPFYSVPVIRDLTSNRVISDSIAIARYLDEQYPDTPKVLRIDEGFGVLQYAFLQAFRNPILSVLMQFCVPKVIHILNPESQAYFRSTRETHTFKKRLEEVTPRKETGDWEREWKQVEKTFGKANDWFINGGQEGKVFITGDNPVFADFVIGGYLMWVKTAFGEDSREWMDVSSWHGGRWGTINKELEKYATVL